MDLGSFFVPAVLSVTARFPVDRIKMVKWLDREKNLAGKNNLIIKIIKNNKYRNKNNNSCLRDYLIKIITK